MNENIILSGSHKNTLFVHTIMLLWSPWARHWIGDYQEFSLKYQKLDHTPENNFVVCLIR